VLFFRSKSEKKREKKNNETVLNADFELFGERRHGMSIVTIGRAHGSEAYLFQDDRHGVAGGGHGGGDEHGGGDSVRKPLHGQREALAAEAVSDEDRLLPGRQRGHHVQERPAVVLEGRHILAARGAGAAPRHVQRRDAVAGGGEQGGHLIPAPRAVADAVYQHEVVWVLRMPLAALLLHRRRPG